MTERKSKRGKDEEVNGQGEKRGAPAPHGAKQHSEQWRKRLHACVAANGVSISSMDHTSLITGQWIIPISSGSSPRGLCRRLDSILSASWFTTSNTVSAISFCQRSDTTSGKFLYNSWSASVSYGNKHRITKLLQGVSGLLPRDARKENSPTDGQRVQDCFFVSAFISLGAALQLRVTPRFFYRRWLPGLSVTPHIFHC